jgi:hypothetical protein
MAYTSLAAVADAAKAFATDLISTQYFSRVKIAFGDQGAATDASATNPLPVTTNGNGVTKTDRSGTITTGSTAQTLMAANAARRGLEIQNTHASADMYINELGAAAVIGGSSIKIPAGALYVADAHGVPVASISIICATATATFAAREW